MESEEASPDTRVTVVLVMHNYTTSVNKAKAIENSNYFSSLLSGNFSDHNLKEHKIKYDISVEIFQNYIDWIENTSPEFCMSIYSQPEKCLENIAKDYDNLLELLETSALLMSDKLTHQLSQIITANWLNLDRSLDIWKFARDHGLGILRDVAFEFCLDRFNELPKQELMELSVKEFVELITNSNINDDECHRKALASAFLKKYQESIDPAQKQLLEIADFETKNNPEYWQCLVTYKSDETKKKLYSVYYLKECQLVELDNFKQMFDFLDDGYEVTGRKIVGRRFSIYVIGGEKGIGTGRFIKSVWRYCLISHTWYHVTEMPTARRHMVGEFIDQNLYLIGGVGSFRVKLSSVDVLNIYTNKWHKGKKIPEEFIEMPPSCVVQKQIIYHTSTKICLYHQKSDEWIASASFIHPSGQCYALFGDPSFSAIYSFYPIPLPSRPNHQYTMIQHKPMVLFHGRNLVDPHQLIKQHFIKREYHRHVLNSPILVSFFCEEDNKVFVEKGKIEGRNYEVIDSFYQQVDNITPSLFSYQLGCFNVINPDTLYKKFLN